MDKTEKGSAGEWCLVMLAAFFVGGGLSALCGAYVMNNGSGFLGTLAGIGWIVFGLAAIIGLIAGFMMMTGS